MTFIPRRHTSAPIRFSGAGWGRFLFKNGITFALGALILIVSVLEASAEETEPGNPMRGAALWAKCQACHTIEPNGANKIGPNLYGVFDRPAGAVKNYRYSDALRKSKIVWTEPMLDRYLGATQETIPGSKMYGGLAIAQDRLDLLAWMRSKM